VGTNLTNGQDNPAYGDPRQCQQVHMAASLAVASSVFSGLALLSVLALVPLSILRPLTRRHGHGINPSGALQLFNAWTIFCLLVSAAMLVLAQFYGILGLVQSAFPNGDFIITTNIGANYGPWMQGKAVVVYASVGWFAGLLAAGWNFMVWGLPTPIYFQARELETQEVRDK
jgi:hypothetical protein